MKNNLILNSMRFNRNKLAKSSLILKSARDSKTSSSDVLKKLLTDPVLIASVTVMGYVLAYSFETGYARQFGYPKSLIELSTGNIAYALSITLVGIFALINLFWVYRTTDVGKAPRGFWTLAFLGVLALGAQTLFNSKFLVWEPLVFGAAAIIVGFRVYKRRYDALTMDPELRKIVMGILILTAFANAFFGARLIGTWQAKTQQNFYAVNGDSTMLAVKTYGNNIIAMRYDPKSKQFLEEIKLIRLDGDNPVVLDRVFIARRNWRHVSSLGVAYD